MLLRLAVRLAPLLALATLALPLRLRAAGGEKHFLYVAVPGIRNYVEYGGIGILVYDADNGYRLVRRIPTPDSESGKTPEAIKGICANARTARLYLTTPTRLISLDLLTEKVLWTKELPGGCDRMSLSPDGKVLYVPSFEGPHWNVVDALSGELIRQVETKSGSHNTVYGPDGKRVYMGGLKSPLLFVADTKTHAVASTVGPFSGAIRPFTVNGSQTLCFVNVNECLGFEVGDLKTGKKLHRVEVAGYQQGPVKRHGCPSHGIALTPDEKELWVSDAANSSVHVFDATQMPPKQVASLKLRDQPGWITFTLDGKRVIPSTGEVIETRTRKIVAALADESGKPVQSEKLLEIVFADGKPARAGDQFGIGQKK